MTPRVVVHRVLGSYSLSEEHNRIFCLLVPNPVKENDKWNVKKTNSVDNSINSISSSGDHHLLSVPKKNNRLYIISVLCLLCPKTLTSWKMSATKNPRKNHF